MTLCKFYLNGNCRYGDNCRFEHADYYSQGSRNYRDGGGRQDFRRNDNYHWQKGGGTGGGGNASDVERIAQAIREEVIIIENGNMWPLTCFAPISQNGNFKDWEDYSPEEMRFEMWKAYQSNTLDDYDKAVCSLHEAYREKRRKLKTINRETLDDIREYLKSSPEIGVQSSSNSTSLFRSSSSVFGNSGASQNFSFASAFGGGAPQSQGAASSFSFSQAFNSQSGSIFGGQSGVSGSIFGGQSSQPGGFGQSQTSQQTSVFGQSHLPQQTSVFAQTPQAQQTSVFGPSQPPQPTSVFGQNQGSIFASSNNAAPPPQSIFGNSFTSSNPQASAFTANSNFGQDNALHPSGAGSVFGQANFQSSNTFQHSFPPNSQPSPFGNAGGGTNQNNAFSSSSNAFPSMPTVPSASSTSIYSPVESLSQEEIAAFEAPTFTFKLIPLHAPPESLCH